MHTLTCETNRPKRCDLKLWPWVHSSVAQQFWLGSAWWFFSPPRSLLVGLQSAVGDCHISMAGALRCLDSLPCSTYFPFLQQVRPSKFSRQSQLVNTRKPNCARRMNGSTSGLLEPKFETGTLGLTSLTLLEERNNYALVRQWKESGILKPSGILSGWCSQLFSHSRIWNPPLMEWREATLLEHSQAIVQSKRFDVFWVQKLDVNQNSPTWELCDPGQGI